MYKNNCSFCYLMETDKNIYKDMEESNLFDFSNFSTESGYHNKDNIFVPGD